MNMIEKVARAICEAANIDPDIIICKFQPQLIKGGGFVIPPDKYIGPAWHQFYHEAKAAIAAMREPSEGMLFAPDLSGHEAANLSEAYLVEIYQAMIDAALKDE